MTLGYILALCIVDAIILGACGIALCIIKRLTK